MKLLAIYLQDHLALSLAGIRLARRCRAENPRTALGAFLDRLVSELEADREALKDVARAIGRKPSSVKEAVAAAGEMAGRLKLNGRVLGYSDLSRVWELEALLAGTDARHRLWAGLRALAPDIPALEGFDFERLEERARTQREELEQHRAAAARAAFPSQRQGAHPGAPGQASGVPP